MRQGFVRSENRATGRARVGVGPAPRWFAVAQKTSDPPQFSAHGRPVGESARCDQLRGAEAELHRAESAFVPEGDGTGSLEPASEGLAGVVSGIRNKLNRSSSLAI